jgi:SusD/RagB-like outer membrane lipoprotein
MNTIKRFAAAAGTLALLVSVGACDNGTLTELNKNPNAPEQVGPELLFPNGTTVAVDLVRTSLELVPQGIGSTWPQYLSEYQYPEISYYVFRPTTADGLWNSFYTGPLQDFRKALVAAEAAAHAEEIGPLLVIRAWTYSYMTGMWGDIPFTEANKADEGVITPTYDTQQIVYDSLLTSLARANQILTGAGSEFAYGSRDPIFQYAGDPVKWRKFANSLRARLGLNLIKAAPARAQTEVVAAINAGGFTSRTEDAQVNWPGNTNANANPWWANQLEGGGSRDDARLSVTFIDSLKSLSDPRLPIFARPIQAAPNDFQGMPNGIEAGAAGPYGTRSSRLGPTVFAKAQPSYVMTYAEYSFIKAEAAERGWIPGGAVAARQYYEEGITASMQDWGVAAADITTYLAQPRVQYVGTGTSSAAGIAQIIVQKWIAAFTAGFEAWSEWRRTGYPNLTPAVEARTNPPAIPRRVLYPQTEQSFNNTNLQAAISSQGGQELTNRIWIDKP